MFRRFLVLAVLLAGCTAQEGAPPPSSSAPPPSSSAVPVPDQWNQMGRRAQSAYVAKEAFGTDAKWEEDQPSGPGGYEHGTPEVSEVCGDVKIGSGFKVTRSRWWRGEYVVLGQVVHALSEQKASELLDQIWAKSRTCPTYAPTDGLAARAVSSDAAVASPEGLDGFYAFCETAPDIGDGSDICMAYLARGDLLVSLRSNTLSSDPLVSRHEAMQQLQKATPLAAKALAAA
ncbi:hypothetical protein ACIA8G_41560 [Lentzea sp. NPDC051213]|uniref:hypothetical protein n=1 Tax=Lentzea sp. NPDC051213 TaxID=3364126 RepID=UPI00378BBBC1